MELEQPRIIPDICAEFAYVILNLCQFWGNGGWREETWGLFKKWICFTDMLLMLISDEHRLADSVGQRSQQGNLVHRHTCMACQHHDLLGLLDYGVNLRYSYTIYMRYISSQETRRFGNSFLNQWTMVFFIYIAYLTLNHPYELLYSFFFQPNQTLSRILKWSPGVTTKDLYMCCIQTLTLKPLTLKIYPPFPFFSLTVTVFTQCTPLRKEWMGEEREKQKDGGRK